MSRTRIGAIYYVEVYNDYYTGLGYRTHRHSYDVDSLSADLYALYRVVASNKEEAIAKTILSLGGFAKVSPSFKRVI